MGVTFTDNSGKVHETLEGNIRPALMVMGLEAVGLTVKQMESGYSDPHPTLDMMGRKTGGTHTSIRYHGDLMRDVNAQVEAHGANTVSIGNSLKYAPFVHEGTYKLAGRPYLRDAIMNGIERIRKAAETELKKGFDP